MLAEKIQKFFIKKEKTLSCAESCTGGLVSSTLVQVPDASLYFLGSCVSYANSAKKNILKVTAEQAVSESCALQMAEGARKIFGSDIATATTGVAGPGGEPLGKVCFAVAFQDETIAWTEHFEGSRSEIIEQSTKRILECLYELCTKRFGVSL